MNRTLGLSLSRIPLRAVCRSSPCFALHRRFTAESASLAHLLCDQHPSSAVGLVYDAPTTKPVAKAQESVTVIDNRTPGNENVRSFTFGELSELSKKLAGVLQERGVGKGDVVACCLPKVPELLLTTLACARLGAIYLPLFTAFGDVAISYRLEKSLARVVVSDEHNRPKIDSVVCTSLSATCITVGASIDGDVDFWMSVDEATPVTTSVNFDKNDVMALLFTSGTTGLPKGVEIPFKALSAFHTYMTEGLEVLSTDVYWNIADPGWAYGLYYNVYGPLLLGTPPLFVNAPFSPALVFDVLHRHCVTNFTAAPTVYRALRAAGITKEAPIGFTSALRVASSAGEPLNTEVSEWAEEELGVPIYDQYGQTELGMLICNHHNPQAQKEMPVGGMGIPMSGFSVAVLGMDGKPQVPLVEGELVIDRQASPSFWFMRYLNDDQRTAERFTGKNNRFYATGDVAYCDAEGVYHYVSRDDDVITSSGYRIGPFEIESVLICHQHVAEAAVVGTINPLRKENVVAFVVLTSNDLDLPKVEAELKALVKKKLSLHMAPREVYFVNSLPKTESGKVQRYLLRERCQKMADSAAKTAKNAAKPSPKKQQPSKD